MNKCPLCGGTVAYQGLNTLECRTVDCDNFCGEEEKEEKKEKEFPFFADLKIVMKKPLNFASIRKKGAKIGPTGSPWTISKTPQGASVDYDDEQAKEALKQAVDKLRNMDVILGKKPDRDNSREDS